MGSIFSVVYLHMSYMNIYIYIHIHTKAILVSIATKLCMSEPSAKYCITRSDQARSPTSCDRFELNQWCFGGSG